jgi:hypothetical protein
MPSLFFGGLRLFFPNIHFFKIEKTQFLSRPAAARILRVVSKKQKKQLALTKN